MGDIRERCEIPVVVPCSVAVGVAVVSEFNCACGTLAGSDLAPTFYHHIITTSRLLLSLFLRN